MSNKILLHLGFGLVWSSLLLNPHASMATEMEIEDKENECHIAPSSTPSYPKGTNRPPLGPMETMIPAVVHRTLTPPRTITPQGLQEGSSTFIMTTPTAQTRFAFQQNTELPPPPTTADSFPSTITPMSDANQSSANDDLESLVARVNGALRADQDVSAQALCDAGIFLCNWGRAHNNREFLDIAWGYFLEAENKGDARSTHYLDSIWKHTGDRFTIHQLLRLKSIERRSNPHFNCLLVGTTSTKIAESEPLKSEEAHSKRSEVQGNERDAAPKICLPR